MNYTLHLGNCLDTLRGMADNCVDSIVTDPPYGLSFMGKKWDYDVPSTEIWSECLRVLKPGGHFLAFAGTRTQHRMAVRIEDAGFEIRDMIAWIYGSGFPKSMDVSKAIDKAAGVEREDNFEGAFERRAGPTGNKKCDVCGKWLVSGSPCQCPRPQDAAVTEAAQQWQGWGTALKPALEPITVARKPLIGTVAANVLEHGTGALNIDGCRVHSSDSEGYAYTVQRMMPGAGQHATGKTHQEGVEFQGQTKDGRWPANLIHDGSDEVTRLFPHSTSGAKNPHMPNSKSADSVVPFRKGLDGKFKDYTAPASSGSAARFFYCAKASKRDRDEGLEGFEVKRGGSETFSPKQRDGNGADRQPFHANIHPTVKPTDLMRYLCRLVTPPGGVVLDPFMGSGSTGKAAMLEGFQFVGCELSPEYLEIARARIEAARKRVNEVSSPKPVQKPKPEPAAQGQNDLFEAVA